MTSSGQVDETLVLLYICNLIYLQAPAPQPPIWYATDKPKGRADLVLKGGKDLPNYKESSPDSTWTNVTKPKPRENPVA